MAAGMGGGGRLWKVRLTTAPEVPALPIPLLRAATRFCLEDELKLQPVESAVEAKVRVHDARVKTVATVGAAPPGLAACLTKQYAKIPLPPGAPASMSFSLTLSAAD